VTHVKLVASEAGHAKLGQTSTEKGRWTEKDRLDRQRQIDTPSERVGQRDTK
jgi:hypothetical protein